jgi:hypothetical protein
MYSVNTCWVNGYTNFSIFLTANISARVILVQYVEIRSLLCSKLFSSFFSFSFLLVYINGTREFHCDNLIKVYSALWASSIPLLCSLNPFSCSPNFFKQYLMGFIMLYIYIYIYTHIYIHTYVYIFKVFHFRVKAKVQGPTGSNLIFFAYPLLATLVSLLLLGHLRYVPNSEPLYLVISLWKPLSGCLGFLLLAHFLRVFTWRLTSEENFLVNLCKIAVL